MKYFFFIFLFFNNVYADNIQTFSENLIKESNIILQKKSIPEAKILMEKNLDTKWMAKFVLGRFYKNIAKEEFEKFSDVYKEYAISYFASTISNSNVNQLLELKEIKELKKDEYIVSVIYNSKTQMDFLVRYSYSDDTENTGAFKIFDVCPEGISILNAQRSEYQGILMQGDIQKLSEMLTSKL